MLIFGLAKTHQLLLMFQKWDVADGDEKIGFSKKWCFKN
jgi:hypothetical protein